MTHGLLLYVIILSFFVCFSGAAVSGITNISCSMGLFNVYVSLYLNLLIVCFCCFAFLSNVDLLCSQSSAQTSVWISQVQKNLYKLDKIRLSTVFKLFICMNQN